MSREEIDFPELGQTMLDRETFDRYVDDLRAVADVEDVRVKGAAADYASEESTRLETACSLLAAGEVRGIQIRYVWDGEAWWDTLIRRPDGVQLTRIQPPTF